MELYQRLEQILVKLRPAFSREAPFEWFVLLLWGVLLTTQPPAVTSYTLNGLKLDFCYRFGLWTKRKLVRVLLTRSPVSN